MAIKINDSKTYIIAEMACSHEGSIALAKKIINASGQAKADAIQFQIWSLKDMVVPYHNDYSKLARIEISYEDWQQLSEYTRYKFPELDIIACVYEKSSVDFAESIGVDAYKIHSSDLANPRLIQYVAQTGRRIDLSVGASTLAEIQNAVQWIKNMGNFKTWLMYGYQSFPTPTDAINLSYMMKLKHLFERPIGYQDHSGGNDPAAFFLPAAAIGMGVDIIEKHITHDRSYKGIDHEAALDPEEFTKFVEMVREIELSKGTSTPQDFSEEEIKYRKYSKKSVVANRALPVGTVLTDKDLTFMRSNELGLPPSQIEQLLGKVVQTEIPQYALIESHHLQ